MVDWNNPAVIEQWALVMRQSFVFILGIYLWEYLITFPDVEWPLLRRRLKFRIVMIPFFLARYLWLSALFILNTYGHHGQRVPNCQRDTILFSTMGTLSVVFASTNLLIRTVMIWRDNWYVIGVLIAANIGHLLAAVIGAVLEGRKSRWNSDTLICDGDPTHSVAFYLYTSILDLVILFLSVAGLYRHGVLSTGSKWRKICNQGVIYVLVTFLINIPTIVLGWLNLNATMNMIGAPLGTTISVIASSRAVMSLLRPRDDTSSSLPVYASSSESSGTRERTFEDKNMHASPVGMLTTHIDLTQNDSRSSVLPSEYSISL